MNENRPCKKELLEWINIVSFAVDDVKLFLDTHPCDKDAMEYFEKYQNVNSLSRELIDGLIDDIYVYEDKKIKVKFKYEDEYNYLIQYIKRRKGDIL